VGEHVPQGRGPVGARMSNTGGSTLSMSSGPTSATACTAVWSASWNTAASWIIPSSSSSYTGTVGAK